jgi:Protein of unknown function (DUF2934)
MISFVFIFMGVVTALAVFAVLAKICASEPRRAEKWEKGEIIKQLVALSERESSTSAIVSPPARSLRRAPTSATGSDKLKESDLGPNSPVPPRPTLIDAEIEEQIRKRAYELYQERGGVDGNATDDWRKAKKEVLSSKAKAARTSS